MAEITSPMYDIDQPPFVVDRSSDEHIWTKINPPESQASLGTLEVYNLEYLNKSAWCYYHDAYLDLTVRIVQGAPNNTGGTAVTNVGTIASAAGLVATNTVCNITPSILAVFRKAFLFFNGVQMGYVDEIATAQLLQALVNQSQDYLDTVGRQIGLILDTAPDGVNHATWAASQGNFGAWYAVDAYGAPNLKYFNEGGIKRTKIYTRCCANDAAFPEEPSKSVQMMIPLREIFPILKYFDRVIRGVEFKLQLQRNTTQTEVIHGQRGSGDGVPSVQINNLSLWVPSFRPSVPVSAKLSSLLATGEKLNFSYPEITMHSRTFSQITSEQTFILSGITNRPLRMSVCFKLRERLTTYGLNSGNFDHMNINNISVRVNGHQIPREEYRIYDSAVGGNKMVRYLRPLQDIYGSSGVSSDYSTGNLLNADNWRIYPMWVFDLGVLPLTVFDATGKSNSQISLQFTQSATYANNTVYAAGPPEIAAGSATGDFICYCLLESQKTVNYDLLSDEMSFSL